MQQGLTKHIALATLIAGVVGCQSEKDTAAVVQSTADSESTALLNSFESETDLSLVAVDGVELSTVELNTDKGITAGNQAIKATYKVDTTYEPSFTLTPSSTWKWDELGDFRVAVDITNSTETATHLFVQIGDANGEVHNRSVNIPKNTSETYHIELAGIDLEIESGIRSNPLAWESDEIPFIWRWGKKNIDTSNITYIKFSVSSMLEDRTLVFDNVRLLKNPTRDTGYLANLADQYGQRVGLETAYSVSTDQELLDTSKAELAQLDGKLMADRSKFGGWKNGPKREATGYFRAEKIGDKWSLVDPEGYLFFSTGIANVRMANTSTITGIDFDPKAINQRTSDDLTPEDSLGLNPVPKDALKTRFVASELRHNMFTWLPDYNDPLAKHYGYRRSVHQGALEHGETYSFYQANLDRKYGDDFVKKWKDVTLDRMRNWGFTSFGNWIDPMFYHENRVPYFANGWIIGDFKTVSSGNDLWSPLPDPFDPVFAERARATLEQIAKEVKGNPWCVGVFIDNEKSWGRKGSDDARFAIVLNTLRRADIDSPTKAHFTGLMKSKYDEINALNKQWGTSISSWESFSTGVEVSTTAASQRDDFSMMLSAYANEYFKIVKSEQKRVLPNHMYMGVRFASWGMTPEIIEAAAEHVDVVSYNIYKEGIHEDYWKFLADVDMPSIIGEFHMGANDTGLLNPGLVHAATQQDRANQYVNYMETVVNNPYFVGAHWFQYIDSPLTGRAYDGENYNVGFVSVTDTPYPEMIDAIKTFNENLYTNRFGEDQQ